MSEIYLGKPSPAIEAWCKEKYPVTPAGPVWGQGKWTMKITNPGGQVETYELTSIQHYTVETREGIAYTTGTTFDPYSQPPTSVYKFNDTSSGTAYYSPESTSDSFDVTQISSTLTTGYEPVFSNWTVTWSAT